VVSVTLSAGNRKLAREPGHDDDPGGRITSDSDPGPSRLLDRPRGWAMSAPQCRVARIGRELEPALA